MFLGAFALACSSLFADDVATLQIAISGDDVNVTAPAGALDDTSKIYLVWSGVDCGGELSAWPVGNRFRYDGTLSSAGGTVTFDGSGIPAGAVVRAFATSDIRLIGGYVKIAANQYINTGIPDNTAYGVDFKYRYDGTSTGGAYSSVIASGVDQFTIGRYNNDKLFYLRYGGNGDSTGGDGYSDAGKGGFVLPDTTNPHVYRVFGGTSYLDGNPVKTDLNNGTQAKKGSPSGVLAKTGKTILLGTSWHKTNKDASLSGRYCHGEWHYAKVLNSSGNALVNLVPALHGDAATPEAGFYDTVSGEFFAKSGTGGALAYDTSASVTNTIAYVSALSDSLSTGVTAWWTGAGDRQNINDPANWACTNAAGAEVAGAVPDIHTVVKVVGASNFNVLAGQALSFGDLRFENCSLSADCDWSGLAASTQRVASVSVVEYVDAPVGAYIDTGFKPNNKTRVVMDVTVQSRYEYWFGAWNNGYNKGAYAAGNDDTSVYLGYGNDGGGKIRPALPNGRYAFEFANGVFSTNGAPAFTFSSTPTFQVNYTLFLFGQDRGNQNPHLVQRSETKNIRLHSCQIYDDGALVRDYAPVLKNGTEYCLYDRVSGKLVMNDGTVAFSGGGQTGETIPLDEGECVSVAIDSMIDLAGHKLTLAHMAGDGTITDTLGGGELHVDVAAGETLSNSTLTFAGQMKLVKDGAGTFTASRAGQPYAGGTFVANGVFKAGLHGYDLPFGASGAEVKVGDGGVMDFNGYYAMHLYNFVLDGGTLRSSVSDTGNGSSQLKNVRLEADSTFDLQKHYGFIGNEFSAATLDLGGHTLTVNYANGRKFYLENLTVKNGTVNFVDGGWFVVGSHGALVATNADFTVDAAFDLSSPVSVRNYTATYTYAGANTGNVDFNVYGTFTPETDCFYGCTMRDGSRIDLSGKSGAWSSTAAFTTSGRKTVRFADGANVTIYVGARATAVGDKLVSWNELPNASVTFTLAYDGGEDRKQALAAKPDGLYVVSAETPAYATWDLEAETPGWKFHDASGAVIDGWTGGITVDMQVRFASYEEYVAIAAQDAMPSAFVLTGGFALSAGAGVVDMTGGFAFDFTEGIVIDLNGCAATFPDSVMYGTKAFTVTSGVAGGRLEVDVASGVAVTNTAMTLSGSLALVKTGAGTFVAAKAGQSYTGGTFVNGGWLKGTAATGACGAAQSLITVADGAGYDWAGTIGTSSTLYSFDIAGTGPDGAGALVFSALSGYYTSYCLKNLALSDDALVVDASVSSRNDYRGFIQGFPHTLTLNGHTLTVKAGAKFNFVGVTASDAGTIVFTTDATDAPDNRMASFWGTQDNDLSNVTLDIAANIRLNTDSGNVRHTVGTFVDRGVTGQGANTLTVLDRFQPMTAALNSSVTLGDATHLAPVLDLSGLDAPFVLPSSGFTMNLAEGATIRLKIGSRPVSTKRPVVAWSAENPPASVGSLVFTRGDEDRRYAVTVKDDGVYLRTGFAMIVR